jgi:predicted trehalose synthase
VPRIDTSAHHEDWPMDRRDELDDRYEAFLDLTTTTALAALSTVIALMHGDVFFGMLFGAATGFTATHLIQRSVDL